MFHSLSLYLAYSAPFFKFLKLALPTPHDADALSLRGCSCCGLVPDPTTSAPGGDDCPAWTRLQVRAANELRTVRVSAAVLSSHAAESAPPPLCGYRLPLVVPEHPWDGRATRPPLANVAAKSTSGISVPSCGSPTRLGLWQLRPNYPLGALTKECAATRARSPPVTTLRPSDHSNWRYPPAPRGRFESAEQSCLPLGPVRLSIGTDAAVPRTHDIPSVPCSRAFATTGAPPTISCPLPAPLGTPGHQALRVRGVDRLTTVSCRFRATSLSQIGSGAMASAQCQHLLPRVAPRRVYATAITTPRQQSRQLPFGSHVIPPSKSAMSPFAATHGAQTWALQPGPLQAAPTRRRTRSSKQVSSGGVVREESGKQASRADYVGSI